MTSKTLNQGLGVCHLSPSLSPLCFLCMYVCLFFLKLSGHLGIYSVQFKGMSLVQKKMKFSSPEF